MAIKCWDILNEVLTEATSQFAPTMTPNYDRVQKVKIFCNHVDTFAAEMDATEYHVNVNEENTDITVEVTCPLVYVEDRGDAFYKLARVSKLFGFKENKDGDIVVSFVIPGVWEGLS